MRYLLSYVPSALPVMVCGGMLYLAWQRAGC